MVERAANGTGSSGREIRREKPCLSVEVGFVRVHPCSVRIVVALPRRLIGGARCVCFLLRVSTCARERGDGLFGFFEAGEALRRVARFGACGFCLLRGACERVSSRFGFVRARRRLRAPPL
ncbi:MAG: hypothetical protein Q4B35_06635, partial [Slackia sp.]|nr:hypothetical protein [Slackia sp.]